MYSSECFCCAQAAMSAQELPGASCSHRTADARASSSSARLAGHHTSPSAECMLHVHKETYKS